MRIFRGELAQLRSLTRPLTIRKYLKKNQKRFLHLGCGKTLVPGWLNADRFAPEADIYMNASSKWPFSDQCFDLIYTEHMLEHIKVDRIPFVLSEMHRTLKKNGALRITVPDLEIFCKKYVEKDDSFFAEVIQKYQGRMSNSTKEWKKYWLIRTNGGAFMTRAVQRFYKHRFMYDFETLSSCLKEIGFSKVTKQTFQVGEFAQAAVLDQSDRAWETLYVEAVK